MHRDHHPGHKMLFQYTVETPQNTRCYRADLTGMVTAWLMSVGSDVLDLCVKLEVGNRGEFVAKFLVPDNTMAYRVVTLTVDRHRTTLVCGRHCWTDPYASCMRRGTLDRIVNSI
jgi:hypothetical protein